MQFDSQAAQVLLKQANEHFAGMLPSTTAPLTPAAVSEHAKQYVAAIEGLQQQLLLLAAPTATTHKDELEQEVSALQQEVARADALLHETSVLVQQWQYRCQDLRSWHEAVLTHGIGTAATQDTPATGAAAEQ